MMEPELPLHSVDENLLEMILLNDPTLSQGSSSEPASEMFKQSDISTPDFGANIPTLNNECVNNMRLEMNDRFSESSIEAPQPQYVNFVQDQAVDEKCPICGCEASRHIHYGGRGCPSCRAFFRRSVQSNSYKSFKCGHTENCVIDSKSWKSCRFCRFQNCLKSGMKPSWVLNEEERRIRHEKRTGSRWSSTPPPLRGLSSEGGTSASPSSIENPWQMIRDNGITEDEMMVFINQKMRFKNYVGDHFMQFYFNNPNAFKSMITSMYFGTALPYSTQQCVFQNMIEIYYNFHLQNPDMVNLCHYDKTSLLRENLQPIFSFTQSISLIHSHTPILFGKILDKIKASESEEANGLIQAYRELNITPKVYPNSSVKYDQIYTSPWAPDISLEERHKSLEQEMSQWPIDLELTKLDRDSTACKAKVDNIMVTIISQIFLFNTDFINLKDQSKVALIQDKYLKMLHRYLKFKYDHEADERLGNGLKVMALARESSEIRKQRLPF